MEAANSTAKLVQSAETDIDWEAEYQRSLPKVYRYFSFWVGDRSTAEDLTSATFEKAWSSRRHFNSDRGSVISWLLGIARNVKADHFRNRRRAGILDEAETLPTTGSVEDSVQLNSDFDRMGQLLRKLSERDRELVALKYGAALTNRRIAEMTGLTESNVGTILHRVVRRLRAQWEELS